MPPRRMASASARTPVRSANGAADDHEARDRRRRRVVLGDELLDHLSLVPAGCVRQIEALPLGEDAVADLEDLCVRRVFLGRDRDDVRVVHGFSRHAPALHQRAHRVEAVAIDGRALELLRLRRLLHLAGQIPLHIAVAAGEETRDRVDVPPVLLAVDITDAGRLAALYVVVETGHARAAAGLRPVASAVLK